jgi:antitoxin VapB
MSVIAKTSRRVRFFRNRYNQALRIPRELELPGNEAILYKDGPRLIIEPVPCESLADLLMQWEPLDEEWPEIAELPARPVKI